MAKVPARIGLALAALIACACTTTPAVSPPSSQATPASSDLAGSRWRLEQFQSSDDAVGVLKPAPDAVYEMEFTSGDALSMHLDCNRAACRWSTQPTAPGRGTLALSAPAMTRAMCPPGSLDTRIARDAEHVRSYVLDGDRLSLSLEADGGIYTWLRIAPTG
jgi:heat shock protein HslJ